MIKVPADKLAAAVEKYLLPGLLRRLAEQQRAPKQERNKHDKK